MYFVLSFNSKTMSSLLIPKTALFKILLLVAILQILHILILIFAQIQLVLVRNRHITHHELERALKLKNSDYHSKKWGQGSK